jgi:Ca-activated chloride channel family protein
MIAAPGGLSFGGLDARIHLVWVLLLVVLLAFRAAGLRRAALLRFVAGAADGPGFRAVARRRRTRLFIFTLGMLLLLFAALEPRSNPVKVREKTKTRDLAVLVDVSRSMLAKDRRPNRLESVKLELSRLADHLSGVRVGVVAFAGEATVVCPLTGNYSYLKRTLKNISPHSVGQGGTKIGDAIRKAATDLLGLEPERATPEPATGETVLPQPEGGGEGSHADILLITDGEDHDSYPGHAVRNYLQKQGVGLYIVGVGSPEGQTVPGDGGPLQYEGEVVRSALEDKALRELVMEAGRGRYLPASVHHFDLVDFYDQVIAGDEGREVMEERIEWREIYQPFALAGLFLVLLSLAVPIRVPPRTREVSP